jgi:hypothetical protein
MATARTQKISEGWTILYSFEHGLRELIAQSPRKFEEVGHAEWSDWYRSMCSELLNDSNLMRKHVRANRFWLAEHYEDYTSYDEKLKEFYSAFLESDMEKMKSIDQELNRLRRSVIDFVGQPPSRA